MENANIVILFYLIVRNAIMKIIVKKCVINVMEDIFQILKVNAKIAIIEILVEEDAMFVQLMRLSMIIVGVMKGV